MKFCKQTKRLVFLIPTTFTAIRFYRQAMQLVPNIEFRIRDASIIPSNGVTGKNSENNTHGP